MVFRAWVVLTTVIGLVQAVLALLSILQNDALLSDLLGRRLSVIAQNSASAYQPFIELGLPLEMVRNGDELLERAVAFDPDIEAIHAVDPSGKVIYSSVTPRPDQVSRDIVRAMTFAEGPASSLETQDGIHGGFEIMRAGGSAGAVVVTYPVSVLARRTEAFSVDTILTAVALWAAFSIVAWGLLRVSLAEPQELLSGVGTAGAAPGAGMALLRQALDRLRQNVERAEEQYRIADRLIVDPASWTSFSDAGPVERKSEQGSQGRSLAPSLAVRLAPAAGFCIVGSALALAAFTFSAVTTSVRPEMQARIELISSIVGANVERAVAAGIPINHLVGAEQYFGDLMERFPEIARIAVVSEQGQTILETLAPSVKRPGHLATAQSSTILIDGEPVGAVEITSDPRFVAKRFQDVFLDTGVVVLVSVLLSFEVMVLMSSLTLTAPLDRLQRLSARQAAGDFSLRVAGYAWGSIGTLSRLLSERSAALHGKFQLASQQVVPALRPALEKIGHRFGLSGAMPSILRTNYFTNLRLALFLFAAADELHASFFVLYIRSSANPWPSVDTSLLLSLPFIGFQLTGFLVAPFARRLTDLYGSRRLLILAAMPVIAGYVGIYFSSSIPEIAMFRTLSGVGYALSVLACEDYAIDTSAPAERARTLGAFSMVYFGGVFAGTALGGVLADRVGQAAVFLAGAAMVSASLGLVLWLTRPRASPQCVASDQPADAKLPGSWRSSLADRRLIVLLLGIVGPAQIIDQAYTLLLIPLILEGLGFSVADIARCLMLYCIAVAGIGNVTGYLARFGVTPFATAVLALALAGASIVYAASWQTPAVMVGTLVLIGIGFGLARWAAVSIAVEIAERKGSPSETARVLGILRAFERIANVSTLFLISALAGRVGYEGTSAAIGFCALVGATVFMLFAWRRRDAGVSD